MIELDIIQLENSLGIFERHVHSQTPETRDLKIRIYTAMAQYHYDQKGSESDSILAEGYIEKALALSRGYYFDLDCHLFMIMTNVQRVGHFAYCNEEYANSLF